MVVFCPECGAKNNIPEPVQPTKKYSCGKCGARLIAPTEAPSPRDVEGRAPRTTPGKQKGAAGISILRVLGSVVVHPILFAIAPIVLLYSDNARELAPSEIAVPVGISAAFAILVLLLSWLARRNTKKTGIILSTFLILFFYYGYVLMFVGGWAEPGALRPTVWLVLAIVCFMLLIAVSYFVIRTHRALYAVTAVLNVVGVVFLLFPAVNVTVHETMAAHNDSAAVGTSEPGALSPPEGGVLPDIYYIILDRYASASTLQDVFDFDDSQFVDFLSSRGFYVASESYCNYVKTDPSLASSLNMEYLDDLSKELGSDFDDVGPIYQRLQDYRVWRLLKSLGYEFVHIGS